MGCKLLLQQVGAPLLYTLHAPGPLPKPLAEEEKVEKAAQAERRQREVERTRQVGSVLATRRGGGRATQVGIAWEDRETCRCPDQAPAGSYAPDMRACYSTGVKI